MYQLGGFLKFLLIVSPFIAVIFFSVPTAWLALVIPIWFCAILFDGVKRGIVILKKIEWEKGPFALESLPLALRQYLAQGDDFCVTNGFVFKDEGLSTFETLQFGQAEVKSLIRLFENPATGERVTQSFAFSWNPANNKCRFAATAWRFISPGPEGLWVTANAKSFVSEVQEKGIHILYVDEPDPAAILKIHRDRGGARNGIFPNSFAEYVQWTWDAETADALARRKMFEDPSLNGYRFTAQAALAIWTRFFAGKGQRRSEIRGLKTFTWKIRPASAEKVLRETVSTGEGGEAMGEQRVAAFRIGFLSVMRNRLYSLLSGPWLSFFALLLFLTSWGSLYQLHMDFQWSALLILIAGLIVDLGLMVFVVTIVVFLLPVGGGRYTERFGKRLMKFYGDVICYEGPHGITTCVLGNFPEARKIGKGFWVKIPGSESFVVKPKQFEEDGYQVFSEEMARKNLIKPSRMANWAPWCLLFSAAVLAWGSYDLQYLKTDSGKKIQGIYNKGHAVIAVSQTIDYMKWPLAYRWWMPSLYFSSLFEGPNLERSYQGRLKIEIWWIDSKGFGKYAPVLKGRYAFNLTPVDSKVYLGAEDYEPGQYPPQFMAYRIDPKGVVLLTDVEAKPLLDLLKNNTLVLSGGWKSLSSDGWDEYRAKPFQLKLPLGYEFFSAPEKDSKTGANTFGLMKDGKVIVSEEEAFSEGFPREITREEYEKALKE